MAHKARFLYVNDDGDYQEGMSAGVFITDVQPQDGNDVVNPTYEPDTVGQNVIQSIETDTELLRVTVQWDGTAYHYNGDVSINGTPIPMGNVSQIDNTRRFEGFLDIDLGGEVEIIALHDDGAYGKADVTLQGVGPVITDIQFVGGYPGSQTEVKENDTFDLEVHFDPAGSEPSHVEVSNFGACKFGTFDLSGTELVWGTTHQATITVTIDATGTSVQALPARARARNDFGTFGATLDTDHDGTVDGTNRVNCNDQVPQLSFGAITYASGFDALKDSETADVAFSYSECDSILFTSPNNQLSITDDTTLETTKTVTRINGDYNVSVTNLRVVGQRDANDTQTTVNDVVFIAHVLPDITITEPAARLISGGNDGTSMQNHVITISSNQLLRSIPTLSAPVGSLSAFSGSVPGSTFTATLGVHDNDARGVHTWASLVAVNLAGLTQNIITGDDTYEIGGFVERDIYFSPQSNEETLGVNIGDATKTVCLDKDLQAMTYQASNLGDVRRGYTFTQPSGVFNANGNILYWNDVQDVENNTTGLSFIRIREDA